MTPIRPEIQKLIDADPKAREAFNSVKSDGYKKKPTGNKMKPVDPTYKQYICSVRDAIRDAFALKRKKGL